MTTLTITRGLPGSGKSTWARQQPGWRVNRDDLRNMVLHSWPHGDDAHEDLLTGIQRGAAALLLESDIDVIIDDTNLRRDVVEYWRSMARRYGAEFHIEDFTGVPLEECLIRNKMRPPSAQVPSDVIRGMHARYLAPSAREGEQP